jgi:multimeric flavodoxin WrbA
MWKRYCTGGRMLSIDGKMKERMLVVLVVTHSRKGFTDSMSKAIAEGATSLSNVRSVIKRVNEVTPDDLVEADGVAFGSPIYMEHISGELKHLLDNVYYKFAKGKGKANKLYGKPAVAFVSGRTKGFKYKRYQIRPVGLHELEDYLFSSIHMRRAAKGIHLIRQTLETREVTSEQAALCRNLGKKLAEECQHVSIAS